MDTRRCSYFQRNSRIIELVGIAVVHVQVTRSDAIGADRTLEPHQCSGLITECIHDEDAEVTG